MSRKIVIIPATFSGPWSFGFAGPVSVYGPAGEGFFAVLVTDPHATIPADGKVFELGPLCTINSVLARAGVTRTRPPPPPPVPEPVVVVVAPSPEPETVTDSVAAAEPVVIVMPPVEEVLPVRLTLFQRAKNFFKRGS